MTSSRILKVVLVLVLALAIGSAVYYSFGRTNRSEFCFNFLHDTQFGDRAVAKPSNIGWRVGTITYYLPEVPALQTALEKQGLYIDPYEKTGGKIYAAAFFGPSTHAAVMDFQKKHGLDQSGVVDNKTIDALNSLYSCPENIATSTKPASYTLSTTTVGK